MILAVHPGDSAFISGQMLMPLENSGMAADMIRWGDNALNTYLLVFFVLLSFLNLRNLIAIFPALLGCMGRWKANITIEESLRLAYPRNYVAAVMLLPAGLLCSRYNLFSLDFTANLPASVQTLVNMGFLAVYVLVRRIVFNLCTLRNRKSEMCLKAHHSFSNYFILASLAAFTALGIALIIGAVESGIRTVIHAVTTFFYLIAILRKFQIFNSFCGPIQTFLYLCALEILPTGALIAAAALL